MKIAIIRADRMGDMILTLPIVKAIKEVNTTICIDVYASKKNKKILKAFSYINNIYNFEILKKNTKKYDYVLNFTPGWKSLFLIFFLKSYNKGNLILTSRYSNKVYSKLLIIIFSKIFFNKTLVVNRIQRFNNNHTLHQTNLMFELLDLCKIPHSKNAIVEKYLPQYKTITSNKKICLIHLSSKWINDFYSEYDFLNLLLKLKTNFQIAMTTDETTKHKFDLIFNKFEIINNANFQQFDKIKNTTIFDNLDFKNWTQIIYSSNLVITPECGCTHIASICKIPSKIIYDANNKPNMIYQEYFPWKSKHEKFIFNNKNLNNALTENL